MGLLTRSISCVRRGSPGSIPSVSNSAVGNHPLCETLEPRVLLSQTWTVGTTAETDTQRGTDLKNVFNGTTIGPDGVHTLQLGDTLNLLGGYAYDAGSAAYILVNITGGSGKITIQSDHLANIPAGARATPALAQYMPKLECHTGTFVMQTVLSDTHGHSGAAHDYNFLGLEFCAPTDTTGFNAGILCLGDASTAQYDVAHEAYNFIVDRCYIHGGTPGELTDDLSNPTVGYHTGIWQNAAHVTIENTWISDIHEVVGASEPHGISGSNSTGDITIYNNYIEASGENLIFGGNSTGIPDNVPDGITITHNLLSKPLAWDPMIPASPEKRL